MKYTLALTSLACFLAAADAQQDPECTPCASGNEAFDDEQICSDAVALALETVGGTEECNSLQLTTYQGNCCDSPPADYCSFCQNYNTEKVIPNAPRMNPNAVTTCQNVAERNLFLRQPGGDFGNCATTERGRSEAWCECENVEPSCQLLCDDGSPPPNLDKADPVIFKTCARHAYEFTLLSAAECADPVVALDFDAKAFCCNEPEPDNCSICPEGFVLADANKMVQTEFYGNATCGEIDTYASFLPQDSCVLFVRELLDDPFAGELQCCVETSSGRPSYARGSFLTSLLVAVSGVISTACLF